jgi:curved DNA-binding protein CbpA
MSVPYLLLAHVESGSENENGSKKKSGLDKEVDELSGLLEDFGKKSDKNSSKDSGKKSDTEPKSDKESGKKSGKNSSKKNGKKSVSNNPKSREEESKNEIPVKYMKATQYTSKQRQAVTRVQYYTEKDYYGILDLAKKYSKIEIRKAYKKFLLLTHSD